MVVAVSNLSNNAKTSLNNFFRVITLTFFFFIHPMT